MIRRITKAEIPNDLISPFAAWKNLFRDRMKGLWLANFPWTGEDKNLLAFKDPDLFKEWYGTHPITPEPYRDFKFYQREFTVFSWRICPKTIVELGTSLGIGTFMLHNLNKEAEIIYSVDNRQEQFLPGNVTVPTGYFAKINAVPYIQVFGNSWELEIDRPFNMCFIDADHSKDAVYKDSVWAWKNKDPNKYVILWHDVDYGHPDFVGLIESINRFSDEYEVPVYVLEDSHVAWCYKGLGYE